MSKDFESASKLIKKELKQLAPSGQEGFEGLIRLVLEEITNIPFRLARSGSQYGIDGRSATQENAIAFECKRYSKKELKSAEISSKLYDLQKTETAELWILCATCDVSTQITQECEDFTRKHHIATAIWDWPEAGKSKLLAALVLAKNTIIDFFEKQLEDAEKAHQISSAIDTLAGTGGLFHLGEQIRNELLNPSIGLLIAQKDNEQQFLKTFKQKDISKAFLNQTVTPLNDGNHNVLLRKELVTAIHENLESEDIAPLYILGNEGHGKTWVVAQYWLELEKKPLLVFLSANNSSFNDGEEIDVLDLLARNITPTQSEMTQHWRKKLERIKTGPLAKDTQILVWLDGLNQNQSCNWEIIIHKLNFELTQLNAKLIITCRTVFYKERIQQTTANIGGKQINVPLWKAEERDQILKNNGYISSNFTAQSLNRLLNPRILSLAISLLNKKTVHSEQEITLHHLLFSYMNEFTDRDASRSIQKNSREAFAKELSIHAKTILSRWENKSHDDLKRFELQTELVADCRFFIQSEDDAMSYQLTDDGFSMALSIALVEQLKFLHRNDKDIRESLEIMLEQIGAFDQVSTIVLGALVISLLDGKTNHTISMELTKIFCRLINFDDHTDKSFYSLANTHTDFFLDAAEHLYLNQPNDLNNNKVGNALICARENEFAWQKIAEKIKYWLCFCTTSVDSHVNKRAPRDPEEEVKKAYLDETKKLQTKINNLTTSEKEIYQQLCFHNCSVKGVQELALNLLASKSLLPFSRELFALVFSEALNSEFQSNYDSIMHLFRLNRIDWQPVQLQFEQQIARLENEGLSSVGQWTKIYILEASGDIGYALMADELRCVLMPEYAASRGWNHSFKNDNCNSDPYDPQSPYPTNFEETCKKLIDIDYNQLFVTRGWSEHEFLIDQINAALLRFTPTLARQIFTSMAENLLERPKAASRRRISILQKHQSLFNKQYSIELARELEKSIFPHVIKQDNESNSLLVDEILMLIFPFLTAIEQVDLMQKLGLESSRLRLLDLSKQLSKDQVEERFTSTLKTGSEVSMACLLMFVGYSGSELSENIEEFAMAQIENGNEHLRLMSYVLLANSDNSKILKQFVNSDWSAENYARDNNREAIYGSIILLNASKKELITNADLMSRISPRHYTVAVEYIEMPAKARLVSWLNLSIIEVLEVQISSRDCGIKVTQEDIEKGLPLYDLRGYSDGDAAPKSNMQELHEAFDSENSFKEKLKKDYEKFDRFRARMLEENAFFLLEAFNLNSFVMLMRQFHEVALNWYELFIELRPSKVSNVFNIAIMLANYFSKTDPGKAATLFKLANGKDSLLNIHYQSVSLDLQRIAIWNCAKTPELDEFRMSRLDSSNNDYELALEVYAAHKFHRADLLKAFIKLKVKENTPHDLCRAIMVCGFANDDDFFQEFLEQFKDSKGMIGSAYNSASRAQRDNKWAQYWYEKMCSAENNTDFWRYQNLFLDLVDTRYKYWRKMPEEEGEFFNQFRGSTKERLERRIDKLKSKREKQLFGLEKPKYIHLLNPTS